MERQTTLRIVFLWAAGLATLFAAMAAFSAAGIDLDTFTRDSNEIKTAPPPIETGALSRFTIILWGIAAAGAGCIALIAERAEKRTMFGLLALILFGLALDDGLLIHEVVFPELGLPEQVVLALWGVVAVLWAARYAARVRGTSRILGVLAGGAFAASMAVDVLAHVEWVEDVFKLMGVATVIAVLTLELLATATAGEPPARAA